MPVPGGGALDNVALAGLLGLLERARRLVLHQGEGGGRGARHAGESMDVWLKNCPTKFSPRCSHEYRLSSTVTADVVNVSCGACSVRAAPQAVRHQKRSLACGERRLITSRVQSKKLL